MVSGDLHLFLPAVARDFDQLQPIQQRATQLKSIGCADEHDFGQVNRNAHIVVDERTVLRRVQDLKQGVFWVSFVAFPHLLDLVQ